ncbi:MAG TPA: glycosyl hydrolase, partial [Chthoniobacter sp.]|nr:glycosyl hydrolase [Chthoniobacter sp.]
MININFALQPLDLRRKIERLWEVSGPKILAIDLGESLTDATPVFTVQGKYTAHDSAETTPGYLYGSALLQYDAFWDESFLQLGRERTRQRMTHYITRTGAHDHGSNIVNTFGTLWRLMNESRIQPDAAERNYLELALKCSGAVQAARWTQIANGEGFIHSAHGPHSLQAESLRSLRSLALAHKLGHGLAVERDERISLLRRLVEHARTTAKWSIYYGSNRDPYDVRGRVAQESVFDIVDGTYHGPSTQQGYSPFTTWTRGLAATLLGLAELLEYVAILPGVDLDRNGGRDAIEAVLLNAARATGDYYIAQTPANGVPYWDTGAPGLRDLGDYLDRPAEPFNPHEPVDSSAAAIAAQGFLRLGNLLTRRG